MRKLSLNSGDLKPMKYNHGRVNLFALYHTISTSLCRQVGGLVFFSRLLIQRKQLECVSWIGALVAVTHLTLTTKIYNDQRSALRLEIWTDSVCVNISIMKKVGFNCLKIWDVCARCSCLICSQVCITVTGMCWGFILRSRNTASWATSNVLAAFVIKILIRTKKETKIMWWTLQQFINPLSLFTQERFAQIPSPHCPAISLGSRLTAYAEATSSVSFPGKNPNMVLYCGKALWPSCYSSPLAP